MSDDGPAMPLRGCRAATASCTALGAAAPSAARWPSPLRRGLQTKTAAEVSCVATHAPSTPSPLGVRSDRAACSAAAQRTLGKSGNTLAFCFAPSPGMAASIAPGHGRLRETLTNPENVELSASCGWNRWVRFYPKTVLTDSTRQLPKVGHFPGGPVLNASGHDRARVRSAFGNDRPRRQSNVLHFPGRNPDRGSKCVARMSVLKLTTRNAQPG